MVVTQLSVLAQLQQTVSAAICEGESYFAGGAMQTASGTYTDTFTASGGCDSMVTTNLTVNTLPSKPVVTQQGSALSVPAAYVSYQWFRNNAQVPGASLSSLQAAEDGNYHAAVSDANGCMAYSDTVTVVIIGIRSPVDIQTQMLPNPITNDVLLIFSKIVSGALHVDVYNALGKRVMAEQDPSFTDDKKRIEMTSFEPGIYLISVWGKSIGFTGRVVKL